MAPVQESDVLKLIQDRVQTQDPRVLLGPGDDLAAIRSRAGVLLAGVDQIVDGLHVLADRVPWDRIGQKAVHRSVSDIAAMAGSPLATLASVVLPAGTPTANVELLCTGLHEAAEAVGAPLVGGDVAIHLSKDHPLTISVTVLAEASNGGPIERGGAKAGDHLYVTGTLGGSLMADGTGHHLDFCPRVAEALELLAALGKDLHAMIDISDGLGRDAGRVASASDLQVRIDTAAVPCRVGATMKDALRDGEDYELLCAVAPDAAVPADLGAGDPRCPITPIGVFVAMPESDTRRVLLQHPDGSSTDGTHLGWDHG